jgi:hypothetical protein
MRSKERHDFVCYFTIKVLISDILFYISLEVCLLGRRCLASVDIKHCEINFIYKIL